MYLFRNLLLKILCIGKQWNKKYKKFYPRQCFGVCSYLRKNIEIIRFELPYEGNLNKKKNQELYELRYGSLPQILEVRDYLSGKIRLESKWQKLQTLE